MNFVSVCGNTNSENQSTSEGSILTPGTSSSSHCQHTGIPLFLFVTKDEMAINVQVRCDNMELAADIVQDISKFFKITELESAVNFPQEMEAFEEVCCPLSSR
jgi:hypothetical protein